MQEKSHKWVYITIIIVIVALMVAGVALYRQEKQSKAARAAATEFVTELKAAGLPAPTADDAVRLYGVDGGPFLRGQARGFPHEEGGAPFVELPGFKGGEGVGHFGGQGLREAEEPIAFGRGFAPGQGDLRGNPGPEVRRRHPGVGLFAALEQVEGDGQTGLAGGQGRLSVFQGPDFSNQARTVQLRHADAGPDGSPWPGHIHDLHLF